MKADLPNSAATAHVGQPTTPRQSEVPAAGPNWVAIAALILSIGTLLKTLYSDWRAWRAKTAAKFEADYGTPIRTGLRAYEKTIFTLKLYAVQSGKSVFELKQEIETERVKWIEAADELIRLLKEVDDSGFLLESGWAQQFRPRAEKAESWMIEMTDPSVTAFDDLKRLADSIQAELSLAIVEIRASLRHETSSYDKIFKRH